VDRGTGVSEMVNSDVFDKLTEGIVNGLAQNGFCIGDGLDYEEGSDDESDGTYRVRTFYYDGDAKLQHTLIIDVNVSVESIDDESDEVDNDDEE
jgi:hypothetical protein